MLKKLFLVCSLVIFSVQVPSCWEAPSEILQGILAGNSGKITCSGLALAAEPAWKGANWILPGGNIIQEIKDRIKNIIIHRPPPMIDPGPEHFMGWYIRLKVDDGVLHDDKTVFGYFKEAADGKDKYDAESLASWGLYTTIYHDDFSGTNNYRSDYRADKPLGSKSETWIIKVHYRKDPYANVTLSWDGITLLTQTAVFGRKEVHQKTSPELERMRLVDPASNTVINVSETDNYTFNMEGSSERTLQWILLKDDEEEPRANDETLNPGIKAPDRFRDMPLDSEFPEPVKE